VGYIRPIQRLFIIFAQMEQLNLPAYQRRKEIFRANATNADVIANMLHALPYAVEQVNNGYAEQFEQHDILATPYMVWLFTRNNFVYRRDPDTEQIIALPSASVRRKFNDCKSYSMFIASVLKSLGLPVSFRFGGNTPGKYSHVWVVCGHIPGRWMRA
jgi:hypothetical protein